MLPVTKAGFEIDARLEAITHPVVWLGLCELRLVNERRWPWLVLIPQRPGVEEMHELTPLDQAMLAFEMNAVAQMLKAETGCGRVNIAMLGNRVPQLHVHLVARSRGDPAWPAPVWDMEPREPRASDELRRLAERFRQAI
jgi:diadenosine tetraphosphate (Ap4A) HIT family hydrolase